MKASIHPKQTERLVALRGLQILDTPREARFDQIVELAAAICETPIAVMNLIDENRQWFKSEVGLGVRETPLETSICSHIILQNDFTMVPDTMNDQRFCDNPLCFDEPNLRFYAGALLITDDGLPIGTLCVLDTKPRTLTTVQQNTLKVLAHQVMAQIQLRGDLVRSDLARAEINHRIKNSLALITSLLSLQASTTPNETVKAQLSIARDRVLAVANLHDHLHVSGSFDKVELKSFLDKIADSLRPQAPNGIAIAVKADMAEVDAKTAVNIGIVVNELATNCIKYAFLNQHTGTIEIAATTQPSGIEIRVSDDGAGLPADFDPKNSSGLGMRVAMALAAALGAGLKWTRGEKGAQFSFSVPRS